MFSTSFVSFVQIPTTETLEQMFNRPPLQGYKGLFEVTALNKMIKPDLNALHVISYLKKMKPEKLADLDESIEDFGDKIMWSGFLELLPTIGPVVVVAAAQVAPPMAQAVQVVPTAPATPFAVTNLTQTFNTPTDDYVQV
jgi:hypothetical protein